MSDQKIPDRSNFLEKFAAIEGFLEGKIQPASKLENKKSTEEDNSLQIISESPGSGEIKKCINCGATLNPEFSFCGSCGNVNESIPVTENIADEPDTETNSTTLITLKCSGCGTSHNPDDIFCENCGNKLV